MRTATPDLLSSLRDTIGDRFEFVRELGRGGMATVFLAKSVITGELVALKVMFPELTATIGGDRFLREIELGTILRHPNIVGVLESGQAGTMLWYTMPFVDGESLRDRLTRVQQLGIEETIALTQQVASALEFAHSKGIIHRDIKPENILLTGNHAFVADFGIARALTVAGGEQLTKTGMAVGTPTYMSPEQALGSRDVTPQSDIYSLGCVVYEMLAGQPPFTAPTAMALLARHSLDNVPSLRIVRSTIPPHVEEALVRALAKTPADRFASVLEFGEALADPSKARPPLTRSLGQATVESRTQITKEFNVRRTLFIALAAIPLIIGGAFFGWRYMKGRSAGADPLAGEFPPNSIAVMYFEDRSPGKQLTYLSDGLTESLIQELGQVSALKVISRNGVRPFRSVSVTPDSVAKALKVGTLVEGTVQQDGKRLRVDVSLVNAVTGQEIASTKVERPKDNLFELQDDLAKEVSSFLRKRVGQEIQVLQGKARTHNSEAWEVFQRGRQKAAEAEPLVAAGDPQAASRALLAADSVFARAEALDSKWAMPIVDRGWLSYRQSRLLGSFDKTAYSKWIGDGLEKAARALAIDAQDPDALELRGTLRYWRWLLNLEPVPDAAARLFADAEADFRRSVAVNRNQAGAWNSLSHLTMAKSQSAEAKIAALNAYNADPYLTDVNKTLWRLFQSNADLGDAFESRKWCSEGARRFPNDFRFSECKLWLFALPSDSVPKAADIWKAYDAFIAASPAQRKEFDKMRGGMEVALGLIRAKLPDSARAVAVRSRGTPETDPTREVASMELMVRAQLGDKDEAFKLITTFLASNPQYRETLAHDESWWLSSLRSDPRYTALQGSAK